MLSLKDFRENEIQSKEKIVGGELWGYSYQCNGSNNGFSTIGPNINYQEGFERCGSAGFVATPIYQ